MTYYLNVADFIQSFIEIPTKPILSTVTSTTDSSYLAGIANLYDPNKPNVSVGRCSASFLCFSNGE